MITRIISRLNRVFKKEPEGEKVLTIWRNVPFVSVVATDGFVYQLNIYWLESEERYVHVFTRMPGAEKGATTIFATDGCYYQLHVIRDSNGGFTNYFTRVVGNGEPGPATLVGADNNHYALNIVETEPGVFQDTYTRVLGTGTYGRTAISVSGLNFSIRGDTSYNIDISTITINQLADQINALPGFTATVNLPDCGFLLARGLIETNKPQDISEDHCFYYPTSLLYQEMQVYGWALQGQSDQAKSAERQLYLNTAEEDWLDFWGNFFGIPRYNGETDTKYAQRITYQIVRATQNNIALSIIVKETLGVDADFPDAVPNIDQLAEEDIPKAPGRFLLSMGLDNSLTSDEAQALINQVQDIVRKYKASGTDFLVNALRKLVQTAEVLTTTEDVSATINIQLQDTLTSGPVRASAGWRASCPGLTAGDNTAIKEQIFIQTIAVADNSVVVSDLYGG